MVKQLKNRYNDTYQNRKFIVGINRAKMKLFDIEKNQQYSGNIGKKQEKVENFFKPKNDGWSNTKPSDWSF